MVPFILLTASCLGAVRLPKLVSTGMVLQRNEKIKIWGWASPLEKIKITFNQKNYTTQAYKNGDWELTLPPLKAGGPYEMVISGENKIVVSDILIGDVWLCAGQSNMVLPMERVKEKYPTEIKNANYPQIRNFFIPTSSSVTKLNDDVSDGKWIATNPQSVLAFGATSYFFAQRLFSEYHVPIGIINASVGGTPIQAWISENGLRDMPPYVERLKNLKDTAFMYRLKNPSNPVIEPKVNAQTDEGLGGNLPWYDEKYDDKNWQLFWLPGYWADQGVKNLNGVVWFRKKIIVADSLAGKSAKLYMGRIVDADEVYVNGKLCGNTTYQYPPRRYTVNEGILKSGLNTIVVRVMNYSGKGGFVPEKPYYLVIGKQQVDLKGEWRYKVGQVFKPRVGQEKFSEQNEPTSLYNTMVAPLNRYALKGIVWYQGETNANDPSNYLQLMKSLISDWRTKWNALLPFIYVQLPNYMEVQYSPSESKWAEMREAQLKTLTVPKTGMAVTIDAGEWNDIHPLDKKTVGERSALLARAVAYGEPIIASGPLYKSFRLNGSEIIIDFTSVGSGLTTKDGGRLNQFAIAGADKKFVWAKAMIDGDKVVVSSVDVPNPKYVRYAWADNPLGANLQNKEGLLASPFRTEF
ncbi:MAG: sialate O-acetylesterase [Chitinophagaceae bacterium]|nr:MAG: sialate O-acetylesterase [Chitinophagaceae bacterium]